jgi:hypothetical protein
MAELARFCVEYPCATSSRVLDCGLKIAVLTTYEVCPSRFVSAPLWLPDDIQDALGSQSSERLNPVGRSDADGCKRRICVSAERADDGRLTELTAALAFA